LDGAFHPRRIDVGDVERIADSFDERQREIAAEMFPEFFEPVHYRATARSVAHVECRMPQGKSQTFEQDANAGYYAFVQQAAFGSIAAIEREADGDGFAVANFVVGQAFDFVRRPMAEIERLGVSRLEGISATPDVFEV
jgi:hypothetical protein